tara:strand:+ start:52152 stop:52610 length:459 start_codon:yes stop_codon:yes gene_type:complete
MGIWFRGLVLFLVTLLVLSIGVISLSEIAKSPEKNSPSDWIKESQINVYKDKVILDLNNPTWAKFTNTNSMDPFLDENSHAIEILPDRPEDVKVGDVISYGTRQGTIIHRVVEIGSDEEGVFYIVKGDNNESVDLYKVRYDDLKGVVVAVIY